MFTGNCRRRRKQNPTISASPAESTQSAKELTLRGLLSHQPANCLQLLRPCALASQEMGVELKLNVQAAIKPDPAKGQTSCVKWSEISFFLSCLYMHAHAFKSMQQGCCFLWVQLAQPISISLDSAGDIQATIYRSSIHVLGCKLCHPPENENAEPAAGNEAAFGIPLSFHPLLTVPFSNSAGSGRYSTYLLYPSSAALSGTMSPHLNMVPPPTSTSTLPPPKLIPGSSPSQGPMPGPLCPCPAEERWALDGEGS